MLPMGGNRRRIAVCNLPRGYINAELDAENIANSRLIAAAPELLEALREADSVIEEWTEILRDGGYKSSIIDGDAARKRIAEVLSRATGDRS